MNNEVLSQDAPDVKIERLEKQLAACQMALRKEAALLNYLEEWPLLRMRRLIAWYGSWPGGSLRTALRRQKELEEESTAVRSKQN